MDEQAYRKDMSHLTWDKVYARQMQRADLVPDWIRALRLKPADRVLDVGSGPGFVSFLLAERVGPDGVVYAVDPSAEALAFLERLRQERQVANVKTICADAATLSGFEVDAALISMVLHHTDDPAAIMRSVSRLLKPEGLALVAEFAPDGPCEHGPPRQERLTPVQVGMWCKAAGFAILDERRQTPEHYMVLVQRPL